jgi:hypothetical protein
MEKQIERQTNIQLDRGSDGQINFQTVRDTTIGMERWTGRQITSCEFNF